MLNILINCEREQYEAEGAIIEIMAELNMAVESVLKKLMEDVPSDIKPTLKRMAINSLEIAVNRAFK